MDDPTPQMLRARYLARLTEELAALRAASDGTALDRQPVELDQQSVGRLSRMDAMQQQAMAAAQEARRGARIAAVRSALDRLAGDDFGYCNACGDFIGFKRLDLDPTLGRCVGCAR
ncbi:MAG: TraR/DksA family transcriptional regulator [Gemmobacter sp.]